MVNRNDRYQPEIGNNVGVALTAPAKQDNAEPNAVKLNDAIAQYRQAIAAEPRYALPYNDFGLFKTQSSYCGLNEPAARESRLFR
jgi:hypothetical protein